MIRIRKGTKYAGSREEAEKLARAAYDKSLGRKCAVAYIMAENAGEGIDFSATTRAPFIVKVLATPTKLVERWLGEFLDPLWNVEIIDAKGHKVPSGARDFVVDGPEWKVKGLAPSAPMLLTPNHYAWDRFIMALAGPKGCDFRDVDGRPRWTCASDPAMPAARMILGNIYSEERGRIDIEGTLAYFTRHGCHCDCEIFLNIDEEGD